MKVTVSIILFLASFLNYGQNSKLSAFNNLVSKTWKAEGNWGDGSKFMQETDFKYSLDSTIVIVNSIGFINKEQTKLGKRNHGIRQFDNKTNSILFWEFDIFGGLTKGTVSSKEKNIIYTYDYGGSTVTDMWEYIDDSTYNFRVGSYENGTWKQVYLSTQFKLVQ